MPIGTLQDMKVYDPRIRGGFVERLLHNFRLFNSGSRGGIRLVTNRKPGQFEYESLFKNVAGLVRRRDPASTATVADKKLSQSEIAKVKIDRGIGPVAITLDSLRKAGYGGAENTLKFTAGVMAADAATDDMLQTAIRGMRAAVINEGAGHYTIPASGTMTTSGLVNGLAKFGDAASSIIAWVMHSKVFYDLVQQQIAANIDGISNFNVQTAQPVTLNRPVIVTDSEGLLVRDGTQAITDYLTLGLTPGSVELEETENEQIFFDLITGLDNLVYRMQGEYAFNVGVKGFTWDVTNGGANPTDTAILTGTNWDKVIDDVKGRAGVVIQSK